MVTEATPTLFDALRTQEQHVDELVGAAVTHCLTQMADEQVAEMALTWAKDTQLEQAA